MRWSRRCWVSLSLSPWGRTLCLLLYIYIYIYCYTDPPFRVPRTSIMRGRRAARCDILCLSPDFSHAIICTELDFTWAVTFYGLFTQYCDFRFENRADVIFQRYSRNSNPTLIRVYETHGDNFVVPICARLYMREGILVL